MNHKFIFLTFLLFSFSSKMTLAELQTNLVKDIWSGSSSSTRHTELMPRSIYTAVKPVNINGTLFFSADDGVHGEELWQSDGTAAGTKMFEDFILGAEGSEPSNITSTGNDLFLTRKSNEQDYFELIKIDTNSKEIIRLKKSKGTPHNTPGNSSQYIGSPFKDMSNINGTLIFRDNSEENYNWKTDGTVAGTRSRDTERIHISDTSSWTMKDNNVIFTAWEEGADGSSDLTLWQSKGVGKEAVKINGDYGSIAVGSLVNMNLGLFFIAEKEDENFNLWKYDETGTLSVKELSNNVHSLIKVKDKLFFISSGELWISDGTSAGTKSIKSNSELPSFFHNLTSSNDTLFFTLGAELWKSDGTVAGTVLVKKFQNKISTHSNFIHLNELLFFVPDNYFPVDRLKSKGLWQSDGTEAGTTAVQFPETTYLSNNSLFNINNSLFFFADDGIHGRELWTLSSSEEIKSPVCEIGLDPQTIKAGQGTALWWWSQNVTTAHIDKGIGEITIPSNYKWVYPTETTTYTMTAKDANGVTTTCKKIIVVEAGNSPPICEMGADPQVITAGEGTALWWWSQNVSSATINNEKWSVSVPSDYAWFYPSETATYSMTAIGDDGSTATCNTTITVE